MIYSGDYTVSELGHNKFSSGNKTHNSVDTVGHEFLTVSVQVLSGHWGQVLVVSD
jgi:hypothetical protein